MWSNMHNSKIHTARRPFLALTLVATTLAMSACGGSDDPAPLQTVDGAVPLVIGHRGLPGLYPEETRPAYEGAADAGADSLEEDLHLTKDCVLVARHNPWLSDNTNIADVAQTNADRRGAQAHRAGRAGQREVLARHLWWPGPVPERPDQSRPIRSRC